MDALRQPPPHTGFDLNEKVPMKEPIQKDRTRDNDDVQENANHYDSPKANTEIEHNLVIISVRRGGLDHVEGKYEVRIFRSPRRLFPST
jgi:hypothetical protein